MMSDFRSGLTFWWRGWAHLLQNRKLLVYALMPALFAIAFAGGFVWMIFTYLGGWVQGLVVAISGITSGFWYDVIYYPLVVGSGLIVFIASIYASYLGQKILAVPFYSLLAEKTLVQAGKKTRSSWSDALRMLKTGLAKTLLLLLVGLVLFVFSFIPVLNIVAISCALFILAFDCIDYSFECMGMNLKQRLRYLFRERAQWAGMAAGLALTLLVPGLTLLVIPGAIAGGALILKEHE